MVVPRPCLAGGVVCWRSVSEGPETVGLGSPGFTGFPTVLVLLAEDVTKSWGHTGNHKGDRASRRGDRGVHRDPRRGHALPRSVLHAEEIAGSTGLHAQDTGYQGPSQALHSNQRGGGGMDLYRKHQAFVWKSRSGRGGARGADRANLLSTRLCTRSVSAVDALASPVQSLERRPASSCSTKCFTSRASNLTCSISTSMGTWAQSIPCAREPSIGYGQRASRHLHRSQNDFIWGGLPALRACARRRKRICTGEQGAMRTWGMAWTRRGGMLHMRARVGGLTRLRLWHAFLGHGSACGATTLWRKRMPRRRLGCHGGPQWHGTFVQMAGLRRDHAPLHVRDAVACFFRGPGGSGMTWNIFLMARPTAR